MGFPSDSETPKKPSESQVNDSNAAAVDESDDDANYRAKLGEHSDAEDSSSDDESDDELDEPAESNKVDKPEQSNDGESDEIDIEPNLEYAFDYLNRENPENTKQQELIGYSNIELEFDQEYKQSSKQFKKNFPDYKKENIKPPFYKALGGLKWAAHPSSMAGDVSEANVDDTVVEDVPATNVDASVAGDVPETNVDAAVVGDVPKANIDDPEPDVNLTSSIIQNYKEQCAKLIVDIEKKYPGSSLWAIEFTKLVDEEIDFYAKLNEGESQYFQLMDFIVNIKAELQKLPNPALMASSDPKKLEQVKSWYVQHEAVCKSNRFFLSPGFKKRLSELNKLLRTSLLDDINKVGAVSSCIKTIDSLKPMLMAEDGSLIKTNLSNDLYNFKEQILAEINKISNTPIKHKTDLQARNDKYADIAIFVSKTIGEIKVVAQERAKIDACPIEGKVKQIQESCEVVNSRLAVYGDRYTNTDRSWSDVLKSATKTLFYTVGTTTVDAFAGAVAGAVAGFFIGNVPGAIIGVAAGAGLGGLASLPVNAGIALKTFGLLGGKDKGLIDATKQLIDRAQHDFLPDPLKKRPGG